MRKLTCPHCHRDHWTLSPTTTRHCPYCQRPYHVSLNAYTPCQQREEGEYHPRVPSPPQNRKAFSQVTLVAFAFTLVVLIWGNTQRGLWERLAGPAAADWPHFTLDGGMSLTLPHAPIVVHLPVPESSRAQLLRVTTAESGNAHLNIQITLREHQKGMGITLTALGKGVQENLRRMPEISGYVERITESAVAGLPALRIHGRFHKAGVNVGFNCLTLVRQNQAWIVLTLFPEGQIAARNADQVLQSLHFPQPPEFRNPPSPPD